MRRSTRRKLKVYAVDVTMILLAAQVTVVLKADNKAEASTYTTIQAIQDEHAENGSDAETPENDTKYISAELVVHLGWRTIQNIFSLWEIIPFIDRRQECWNDGL